MRPSEPRRHLASADALTYGLSRHQRAALLVTRAYHVVWDRWPPRDVIVGALDLSEPLAASYCVRTVERRGLLVTDPTDGTLRLTGAGERLAAVESVR